MGDITDCHSWSTSFLLLSSATKDTGRVGGAGHGGKLSDKSRHYGRKVYFGSSFVLCSVGIAFETVVRESSGGLRKRREVPAASNQRRARSPSASFKGAPW